MIALSHRCALGLGILSITLSLALTACTTGTPHKGKLILPPPDAPSSQPAQGGPTP